MDFSFFLVNQKYCIIKLYNYNNKENIKIINMKTKNILKIGVFSIIILTLLISPILKSNVPEVRANGRIEARTFKNITIKEEPAFDICAEVGAEDTLYNLIANTPAWWEHKMCLLQKGIMEGLGKMFAAVINSQTGLIIWAFEPATYGGFVNNPAVQSIWGFIRNLINLALILALVIMAIATILGYKKYAWKQILWKLVVVALLINFSLVIAGMILDVSNFLAYNFLNAAKMNNESIAESMIVSIQTEKLSGEEKYEFTPNPGGEQDTTKGWGLSWGNFFIAVFSLILIGLFALIALLAIFVAMMVRSFILIALLCVSPAAFAAWIFPDTIKFWKMWWDQFIKWCTFPIIFGLMLYIGIFAVNNLGITSGDTELGMIPFIIRIFLFSMFLIGGLIFSLQSGGAASQMVMKQSSKIGAAAGAFVGYKALKGAASSETWRKAQEKLEGSKFAPTHDIGVWMGRQPGKIRAAELKQIEEDYKNRAPDQIRADMEMHKNDRARVAAGLNELIERKKVKYEEDSGFVNIARNQAGLKVPGLKKAHPELYAEYFTKPEDMNKEITQIKQGAPAISDDEAKKRAIISLTTKRVKESDPESIKSGNWDNILERLEKKGPKYIDQFFHSLWDKNVPPEGFAAMLRLMDTEKQRKWTQEFVKSVGRKIQKPQADVKKELTNRKFYKNRFLLELLP